MPEAPQAPQPQAGIRDLYRTDLTGNTRGPRPKNVFDAAVSAKPEAEKKPATLIEMVKSELALKTGEGGALCWPKDPQAQSKLESDIMSSKRVEAEKYVSESLGLDQLDASHEPLIAQQQEALAMQDIEARKTATEFNNTTAVNGKTLLSAAEILGNQDLISQVKSAYVLELNGKKYTLEQFIDLNLTPSMQNAFAIGRQPDPEEMVKTIEQTFFSKAIYIEPQKSETRQAEAGAQTQTAEEARVIQEAGGEMAKLENVVKRTLTLLNYESLYKNKATRDAVERVWGQLVFSTFVDSSEPGGEQLKNALMQDALRSFGELAKDPKVKQTLEKEAGEGFAVFETQRQEIIAKTDESTAADPNTSPYTFARDRIMHSLDVQGLWNDEYAVMFAPGKLAESMMGIYAASVYKTEDARRQALDTFPALKSLSETLTKNKDTMSALASILMGSNERQKKLIEDHADTIRSFSPSHKSMSSKFRGFASLGVGMFLVAGIAKLDGLLNLDVYVENERSAPQYH